MAAGLAAFGFAPILVRYAADYSPMLVAAIRTIAAFLLLLPVYLVRRKKEKAQVAAITDDGIWVLAAGISLGIHFLLWIGSLYYTSVASASVLVTINPILLIIAERMIFKVRFKGAVWIGVLVAFSGSALLGYSDYNTESTFANPLLGNMMALSAAAIFVVYFLIGRKIRQNRTWLGYVFPVYGYAALTCLAVLLIVEGIPSSLPLEVLLVGLGLAIGPQIMGHGSLNYAVKYVSPTLLSTLVLTEPLIATILAFLFFGEWPELLALGAIVITLAGVVLSWRKKPEHEADEQT
ncbi:MAG: DMT family transporter [Balneolaceae bacterium]|nr:DMT family transporter [Balneolaceae bacterium]